MLDLVERPKRTVRRICDACGTEFWGRSPKRFCSIPCMLLALVDRSTGPDGCWLWQGRTNADGYGMVTVHENGRVLTPRVHRLVLEQHLGRRLEPHELARHTCPGRGNPACCNPAHLAVGDYWANRQDEVLRGRPMWGAGGMSNTQSKLTDAAVIAIRASDEPVAVLAARYGVSDGTIRRVQRRDLWRHLSPPVSTGVMVSVGVHGQAQWGEG
jgi:hypothetical protein